MNPNNSNCTYLPWQLHVKHLLSCTFIFYPSWEHCARQDHVSLFGCTRGTEIRKTYRVLADTVILLCPSGSKENSSPWCHPASCWMQISLNLGKHYCLHEREWCPLCLSLKTNVLLLLLYRHLVECNRIPKAADNWVHVRK